MIRVFSMPETKAETPPAPRISLVPAPLERQLAELALAAVSWWRAVETATRQSDDPYFPGVTQIRRASALLKGDTERLQRGQVGDSRRWVRL